MGGKYLDKKNKGQREQKETVVILILKTEYIIAARHAANDTV